MHTAAHVVLNSLTLGHGRWRRHCAAVVAGAVAPDLPMVAFYAVQRYGLERASREIWSHDYFQPHWQAFIDIFNSFPLIALAAWIAWRLRRTAWFVFFLSMGLHCAADFPVHHDDAHAHFFPLSSWRFESPVSYWDPRHHGRQFRQFERWFVLLGSLALTLAPLALIRRRKHGVGLLNHPNDDDSIATRINSNRRGRADLRAAILWFLVGAVILMQTLWSAAHRRRPFDLMRPSENYERYVVPFRAAVSLGQKDKFDGSSSYAGGLQ